MSAGLKGLMKYRFQKRDEVKLQSSPPPKPSDSTTKERNDTVLATPGKTATLGVVPDTPESRQAPSSTSSSPVFNGIKNTQHVSGKVNNNTLRINTVKPGTGSGKIKIIKIVSPQTTARVSENIKRPSYTDRDLEIGAATLRDSFPDRAEEELIRCLKFVNCNVDKALTLLMSGRKDFPEPAEKRCHDNVDSPDSSPVKRVYKRARIVSSDEDSDDNAPLGQALEGSQSTLGQFSLDSEDSQTERQNAITFLQESFPLLPRQILQETLTEHEDDVDRASEALLEMCNKHTVETDNVGSIKAMKEARVFAHATGPGSPQKQSHKQPQNGTSRSRSHIVEDEEGSDENWDEDENSSEDEEETVKNTGHRAVVLKFINEAGLTDLSSIAGCSKKKAESIMELRPFISYEDMCTQFSACKHLSLRLVSECRELLSIRQVVQQLMRKCERIARDLEEVISELTSKTSLDDGGTDTEYISQQPALLNDKMKLTPYQLIGLNWLVVMHEQQLNGILGDEMGLGKTIQTISFLAYMKENNIEGPNLVIAPSSTLDNWLRELKTWCPSLKVCMYYGAQEERAMIRRQIYDGSYSDFDVAVTTYNMVTGSVEDRNLFKKLYWHYAVFDEGHMLKNMSSMRYRTLQKISAERRLLLTGTPLQNNLIELMSLLAFTMPDLFNNKTEDLRRVFATMTGKGKDEVRSEYEAENMAHAKRILKPFFLRRLKSEVLRQLPAKVEKVDMVPMLEEQREFYVDLQRQFKEKLRVCAPQDMTGSNSGAAMIMQLRKAANHPLLHRRHYDLCKLRAMAKDMIKEPTHRDAGEQYVFEDMEVMSDFELDRLCRMYRSLHEYKLPDEVLMKSGKFEFLDKLLPEYKSKGSRVLMFSQFTMVLDIIEVYMRQRSHRFLRLDGHTPVAERQDLIDQFTTDRSIFIFLLSTKAGGLGINLTAANVVVLHDIDYNPYNDKQAEDRCHRLGQKQDVIVHRLLSASSIEEGIWKCAQSKLRLEQDVTGQGGEENLDSSDMASLLKEALGIDLNITKTKS